MSFQICSDLHLNYWWGPAGLNNIGEVVEWIKQVLHPECNSPTQLDKRSIILAGDVAPIEWEPLYLFLEGLLLCGYKTIIWTPGNHEFLSPKSSRKTIGQLEILANVRIKQLHQKYPEKGKIYWLNHGIIKYNSVNIIGCTLWSIPDPKEPKVLGHHMFIAGEDPAKRFQEPSLNLTVQSVSVQSMVNPDSSFPISNSSTPVFLTPPIEKYDSAIYTDDTLSLNFDSYTKLALNDQTWLLAAIQHCSNDGPILIITHYPAARWMDRVENARDGKISMYTNNLPLTFFPKMVKTWISGHSHYTTRKFAELSETRVLFVSNPIGYPREHRNSSQEYHPDWVIDLS